MKEQILKDYVDWTRKYIEAHKSVKSFLPPTTRLTKDDKLIKWIPTAKSLAEFENAKNDEEVALTKLQEIRDHLWRLNVGT
ncbi:MAG: hypothetical protein JSV74_01255 [Dehalococcoidia bacterium]|nr:MAG: hypothetical protein JSV74_01255 [Dehalococcoidia bacterium]